MPNISAEELRYFTIFHPYAAEKYASMLKPGSRFVHYCSAEAAYHIIKSGKMRLRNATVMNDFMEIDHGLDCLVQAWRGPAGERLKTAVEGLFPGLIDELGHRFDGWAPYFRSDTYLTSLSEHDSSEDELGRLSMWRAYGGSAGVAVVLNPQVFMTASEALKAYTSPVAYLSPAEFGEEFDRVTTNISSDTELLLSKGKDELLSRLFTAFRYAVLCTKHPGFKEEREWRIIYAPKFEESKNVERSIELIKGVPQVVYSIPFKDHPEQDLVGAELPTLINRVIVGPTEFPAVIREATIAMLAENGVLDAEKKVVCSTIPLRQ
jgi:hypothetical protein